MLQPPHLECCKWSRPEQVTTRQHTRIRVYTSAQQCCSTCLHKADTCTGIHPAAQPDSDNHKPLELVHRHNSSSSTSTASAMQPHLPQWCRQLAAGIQPPPLLGLTLRLLRLMPNEKAMRVLVPVAPHCIACIAHNHHMDLAACTEKPGICIVSGCSCHC
jgi:hypothetical protein